MPQDARHRVAREEESRLLHQCEMEGSDCSGQSGRARHRRSDGGQGIELLELIIQSRFRKGTDARVGHKCCDHRRRTGRCAGKRTPPRACAVGYVGRSEEHTSELQPLMLNSYAVFCLKKKTYV